MKRKTYTYGTTPPAVIRAALEKKCPQGYRMSLVGEDAQVVIKAVNQGIDAHLEAITGDNFKWVPRMAGEAVLCNALETVLNADNMLVLLRRLAELPDDAASSLRGSILSTLDIEEI